MQSEEELLKIGVGLLETFKYKKAIEFFTQVIEINPANPDSYEYRGIARFKIYDVDAALNDLDKAVELKPENHQAWYTKGEILRYKKEYALAEYCHLQADGIYPDSFVYLTGLIQTASAQKKYAETIGYCNQILKESPADDLALSYRGLAYARQKNYAPAIKDFLKLIEIGKCTAGNYNNLGFWYSKTGDIKKAYNNLSIALQINPTHPYALDNMGHVHYLKGDFEKALLCIDQSLDIDPSNSYGYKNRALIYLKTGKTDLAVADLQKARLLGYAEDYDSEVEELLKIASIP
jgi:tetratricopeptide (TPR) repeat protein